MSAIAPAMDGRELIGFSADEIAARVGCSLRTARRWKAAAIVRGVAALLVRAVLFGELEVIAGGAWRGWRVERGELVSPEGLRFKPADILSLPFLTRALEAARSARRFEVQADFVDGRYVEPEPRATSARRSSSSDT